jgi:hypothetical protein
METLNNTLDRPQIKRNKNLAANGMHISSINDLIVKNTTRAQTEIFEKIINWNLDREKMYCANHLGYGHPEHLDEMEVEYKKFMFLVCAYHDQVIPISEKVDDLWHAHVLHTRRYEEFCEHVFGRQIYHNPTVSDEENYALRPDYERNTLTLYKKHFGSPPVKFWLDISPTGACCTH